MATNIESQTITVAPDSELGRLVRMAAETAEPVIVDTGKAIYTLSVAGRRTEADRRPSPEQLARSIAGTRRAAGSWRGLIDPEEFKAYIRERRRTKNRPSARW